ncbi:MAG TPA: DUF3488 and transglutaminase-like domain-containing protein [Phycisphaerales bacterium]|nr:DUF3488 and transglutaminase-like domain-containing protein [Phycisphaerales bacterium]
MTRVLRKIRWCLLISVMLAFFAFASAEGTWPGFALLVLFGGLGWYITEGRPMLAPQRKGWEGLPRWVAHVVLAGALIAAFYRGSSGETVVSAFIAFLASIVVLKLWQKRDPSDYGQLFTMSLFLTIGATLNSNNVGVGFAVLVQTPVLFASAMLLQIWNAQRRGELQNDASDWKRLRKPLAAVATISLLVAVIISAVVFVIVPRQPAQVPGMGSLGRLAGGRQIGFSNQVDLRAGGITSESREVVLLAQFAADSDFEKPIGSADIPQYLRGAVLDLYEDGTWRESRSRNRDLIGPTAFVLGNLDDSSVTSSTERVYQRIIVQSGASREQPVFHIYRGLSFTSPSPARYLTDSATTTARIKSESSNLTYTVISAPRRAARAKETRGTRESAPELAAISHAVLRERNIEPDWMLRAQEDDAAAVVALTNYLKTNHAYSFDRVPPPAARDPVVWWIQEKQAGTCEYFAAALVAMCHSVGIDARVVAGYLAAEFDASTNTYIVRRSDAHAWVEANVGPGVWRTYDATPIADNIQERMRERFTLTGRFLGFLDGIQASWNTRVVAFDMTSQQRLFSVRGETPELVDRVVRLLRRAEAGDAPVVSTLAFTRVITSLMGLMLLAGGIAIIAWGVLKLWRKPDKQTRAGWGITHPQQRKLLDEIVTRAAASRDGTPLREWITRTAPANQRDALLASADDLYAARFSRGETDIAQALAKLERTSPRA